MATLGKQTTLACQNGALPRVFHQRQLEHRGHEPDALNLKSAAFELDVEDTLAEILLLLEQQGRQVAVVIELAET